MRNSRPRIDAVKVTDARQQFSELLNSVYKDQRRVMIEKSGIPVAALISVRDLERLNQLESERNARFSALIETGDAFRDVPVDELEREVARAVARARGTETTGARRASRAQKSKPLRTKRGGAV